MRQCLAHASESDGQLLEDELSLEPEHAITHASQLPIAASVGSTPLLVAPTIDFDDKPGLQCDEVSHETTDGILPAKRYAELPRPKRLPQKLLGPGGIGPMKLCPVLQELLGFRVEGARAHRETPSPADAAGLCDLLAQEV